MADLKTLAEQLVNLSVKEVKELADILKEVVLLSLGNNRMKVYKALKEITGLGLKEAKTLADKAPNAVVKEKVSKAEAEEVKEKLEALGATVEVK